MAVIDALLAELEQESLTTQRVLERVPQAHLSWKPHPKSMSLGQLALHVATVRERRRARIGGCRSGAASVHTT